MEAEQHLGSTPVRTGCNVYVCATLQGEMYFPDSLLLKPIALNRLRSFNGSSLLAIKASRRQMPMRPRDRFCARDMELLLEGDYRDEPDSESCAAGCTEALHERWSSQRCTTLRLLYAP